MPKDLMKYECRYAVHRNPISLHIRKTDKLKKVDRAMRSTFFMSFSKQDFR